MDDIFRFLIISNQFIYRNIFYLNLYLESTNRFIYNKIKERSGHADVIRQGSDDFEMYLGVL
jgi:hypothetical protein